MFLTLHLSIWKAILDSLFDKYSLTISKLRGQGYDGTNNMRGEFNGLKTWILRENEYAYYVHYFAHQFQLTLIMVSGIIKSLFILSKG
jgi:hypothetical protein